jgi:flagellar protein FlgJ
VDIGLGGPQVFVPTALDRAAEGLRREREAPGPEASAAGQARLREAAREFEGVFLGLLMKAMRQATPKGGLFPGGAAREVTEQMFDEQIGRHAARASGVGLAEMLVRHMMQGGRAAGPPALGPDKKSSSRGPGEPIP